MKESDSYCSNNAIFLGNSLFVKDKDKYNAVSQYEPTTNILYSFSMNNKETMPWECYLIKDKREIVYVPSKIENVPNAFQRFMLKFFFGVVWAKRK